MTPMTFTETTETRSFGLLSSRVSQTLRTIVRDRSSLTQEDKQLLERGVALLDRFIDGSRLVEGDVKSGIVPGPESLRGFQQALSTLQTIQTIGKQEAVSQRFRTLRDQLNRVREAASQKDLEEAKLDALSSFFTTLASMFYDDLAHVSMEQAAPHTEGPSGGSLNGAFGAKLG